MNTRWIPLGGFGGGKIHAPREDHASKGISFPNLERRLRLFIETGRALKFSEFEVVQRDDVAVFAVLIQIACLSSSCGMITTNVLVGVSFLSIHVPEFTYTADLP